MNTGGPAFPMIRDMRHNADWDHDPGMSLRDYFAAVAMSGIVRYYDSVVASSQCHDAAARDAYRYADAMLAAREAK